MRTTRRGSSLPLPLPLSPFPTTNQPIFKKECRARRCFQRKPRMSRVHLSLLLCFAVSPFVQSSPALRSIDDSPAATYDALSSNAALSATFLETHSERVGSVASRAALFSEGGDPPPDAAAPPAADPAAAPAAPQGDGCSVCTYVLENKEVQQPFLCRGLSDPAQQIMVCTA